MLMHFPRFLATDKSTCRCRGAPSPPLTTAAAEKTVSGPATETESRAVTETETGRGRERGSEEGRGRESVIGHLINQWTHTPRYSPHTRPVCICCNMSVLYSDFKKLLKFYINIIYNCVLIYSFTCKVLLCEL